MSQAINMPLGSVYNRGACWDETMTNHSERSQVCFLNKKAERLEIEKKGSSLSRQICCKTGECEEERDVKT